MTLFMIFLYLFKLNKSLTFFFWPLVVGDMHICLYRILQVLFTLRLKGKGLYRSSRSDKKMPLDTAAFYKNDLGLSSI